MKIHKLVKIEIGKRYGDFNVISYTEERVPSNGCVMWLCQCVHCGHKVLRNGNNLRFNQQIYCPNCNRNNTRKRR